MLLFIFTSTLSLFFLFRLQSGWSHCQPKPFCRGICSSTFYLHFYFTIGVVFWCKKTNKKQTDKYYPLFLFWQMLTLQVKHNPFSFTFTSRWWSVGSDGRPKPFTEELFALPLHRDQQTAPPKETKEHGEQELKRMNICLLSSGSWLFPVSQKNGLFSLPVSRTCGNDLPKEELSLTKTVLTQDEIEFFTRALRGGRQVPKQPKSYENLFLEHHL